MEKLLGGFSVQPYALVRIVVGLLFACHGAQKLFGVFGGLNGAAAPLFSLMGFAGVIEFLGGLLVAVGFFTGYVAFIASADKKSNTGYWLPLDNHGQQDCIDSGMPSP